MAEVPAIWLSGLVSCHCLLFPEFSQHLLTFCLECIAAMRDGTGARFRSLIELSRCRISLLAHCCPGPLRPHVARPVGRCQKVHTAS